MSSMARAVLIPCQSHRLMRQISRIPPPPFPAPACLSRVINGCVANFTSVASSDIPQWITGAGDPRNAVHIVLAVTDPSNASPHGRHSLVLVDPKAKGVEVVRPMTVFGYDDAPEGHCEVRYRDVKLDVETAVVGGKAGLGKGFAVCPPSDSSSRQKLMTS
jgi:hypothetical protein